MHCQHLVGLESQSAYQTSIQLFGFRLMGFRTGSCGPRPQSHTRQPPAPGMFKSVPRGHNAPPNSLQRVAHDPGPNGLLLVPMLLLKQVI